MRARHLCLVPHAPPSQEKGIRVRRVLELVVVLQSVKHNSWKDVIILDESLVHMHTDLEQMSPVDTRHPKLESAI
jgi:hypothetical protein